MFLCLSPSSWPELAISQGSVLALELGSKWISQSGPLGGLDQRADVHASSSSQARAVEQMGCILEALPISQLGNVEAGA